MKPPWAKDPVSKKERKKQNERRERWGRREKETANMMVKVAIVQRKG